MAENLNPNIFLSYSWANANIADEIDNDFKSIGIQFKRDIRDLEFRKSIKEFMQQVGKSDFVVMIISDEYLRSENCMYEVTELLNTHEFEKRILPILIDNARPVFKAKERLIYYDYWKEKLKEANQLKRKHPNQDYIDLVKKTNSINDYLDTFFQRVVDLNVSSFKQLKQENYRDLLKIVGFDDDRLLEEVIRISQILDAEDQEIELDSFLKQNPYNKYATFQKANLALRAEKYKKAKTYYQQSIDIDPKYSFAHYNLAKLQVEQFDYEGGKKSYEEAIRINPKDSAAHNNLGHLHEVHFSNYELAKEYYEKAIVADPHDTDAYFNLALLLKNNFSDFEGARVYYEKVLEIDIQDVEAHYNLAILLQNNFLDYDGARSHYEKALDIDSQYVPAYINLGNLLKRNFSDFDGARSHYKKAIEIDPQHDNAYNNLAVLLEMHFSDYEGAKQYYQEALKINPQNELAQTNLANLLKNHF